MLWELAVGDAYGAGFEYADADLTRNRNDLSGYRERPEVSREGIGRYTDDTQMSLAIAESLLSGEDWTPENLAERFVRTYHRDPRGGYARQFGYFLMRTSSGAEFLRTIRPDSDKSGAAMRACPIGVLPTVAKVLDHTTVQAKLTHDTPDGIAAAQAAALMPHYFLYGYGPKADLGIFLESYVPVRHWSEPYVGMVKSRGWMSVQAAVTAVIACDRMSDILRYCVDFTGDVDTVATIAMAAASCSREVEQDLPGVLIDRLENGRFGRDYLRQLDTRLLSTVSKGETA
ncbi:MAG: ADP-ribosylglycohydrolase family protein [Capsulimonadales bacterium]|nr:ADP-ribosylglycohydrolase family protein [Capsulimonadales bacterium]